MKFNILFSIFLSVILLTSTTLPGVSLNLQNQNMLDYNPELFVAAFADDEDPEDLVDDYIELIEDLEKLNQIFDEAIIVDFLIGAITNLRTDTENLVTDTKSKTQLTKFLDDALRSVTRVSEEVLELDEKHANNEIDQARKFIEKYNDEVDKFSARGDVSSETAAILIDKANQISSDSQRRGDVTDLVPGTTLTVTNQIINEMKTSLAELTNIVLELQSLGFDVTIITERINPVQGTVSFFNPDTSQRFDIIIPLGALVAFSSIGLLEEFLASGEGLNPEGEAAFINWMPLLVEAITNFEDDEIAALFVLESLYVGHPDALAIGIVQRLKDIFVAAQNEIRQAVQACQREPSCRDTIGQVITTEVIESIFGSKFPTIIVSGTVFNDANGDGENNDNAGLNESFLIILFSPPNIAPITTTNSDPVTGQFIFNEVPVPTALGGGISNVLEIIEIFTDEQIQNGWVHTTPEEVTITFDLPTSNEPIINNEAKFGNRQEGTLIVITEVTNDDEGTLEPSDFTYTVSGNNPIPFAFSGESSVPSGGVVVKLVPGDYEVTQDLVSGYTTDASDDCSSDVNGPITGGEFRTCIFTNNDEPTIAVSDGTVLTQRIFTNGQGGFVTSSTVNVGDGLAGLGDLNGDGVPDFVMSTGSQQKLFFMFMNSDRTLKSFRTSLPPFGVGPNDSYGSAVEEIGDFDGDGTTEIVVGASRRDGSQANEGAVFLIFLDTAGNFKSRVFIADFSIDEDLVASERFGTSVAKLGDLDGDGITDLAVGGPTGIVAGKVREGVVFILFMNADGTVKSSQKISATEGNFGGILDNTDRFGTSVAGIGDLNGDGNVDLAVGAIGDDDGGSDRGAVWILFLNPNGTVKSSQKISATQGNFGGILDNGDFFGSSIANMGDLDGDGIIDLAVGAFFDDDGVTNAGAVWILFMNNDGTVKSFQKISDTQGNFGGSLSSGDRFGATVANLGDIDGNGIVDLGVAATNHDGINSNQGAVYVLFLNRT